MDPTSVDVEGRYCEALGLGPRTPSSSDFQIIEYRIKWEVRVLAMIVLLDHHPPVHAVFNNRAFYRRPCSPALCYVPDVDPIVASVYGGV